MYTLHVYTAGGGKEYNNKQMPECRKKLVRHRRLFYRQSGIGIPTHQGQSGTAAGHGLVRHWPAMLFTDFFKGKTEEEKHPRVRMSGVVSASSSSSQADHFMQGNKEK